MKKRMDWLWCLAVVIFFVDWTVVGLSILNGNCGILGGVCVGAVCLGVIVLCPLLKRFHDACPQRPGRIARGQNTSEQTSLE